MKPASEDPRPRRFYAAVETAPQGDGFGLRLDARGARTPAGKPLIVPTLALAELIAEEWAGQGERIDRARMPATRLASTVLDHSAGAREALADEFRRFAETDAILYFAEYPTSLVQRQETGWLPVIAWAEQALDVRFARAQGARFLAQPDETLARVRAVAAEAENFTLAGLAFAAGLFGSAILAFALQRGELTAETAFQLSRLDEIFQEERWGVDAEAEARADRMAVEAVMLERWFRALG